MVYEGKIELLPWPARSPDFNPIEKIWGILVRSVYANSRQFDTLQELTRCIKLEWSKLEPALLYRLAHSMFKRCARVLERQGRKTDY